MFIPVLNCLVCCVGCRRVMLQCFVVLRWLHHALVGIWHSAQVVASCFCKNLMWHLSSYSYSLQPPFSCSIFLKPKLFLVLLVFFETWPNSSYLYSLKPKLHLIKYFLLWNVTFHLAQLSKLNTLPFNSFSLKPHHFSSYSTFWKPNSTSSFIYSKTPPFVFNFLKPKLHLFLHLF